MRYALLTTGVIALAVPAAAFAEPAPAAPVAAPARAGLSTSTSTINEIIANPQGKAVLEKHVPQILQYATMVGGQTLKQLQAAAGGAMTDEMLAKIDADLTVIK